MTNTATHGPDQRAATNETEPSVDDVFDVLGDARRRRVLSVLSDSQHSMALTELARRVAAGEADAAPLTVSESTVRTVSVALHHVHLPTLARASLVDYDPADGTVARTNRVDAVPIEVE